MAYPTWQKTAQQKQSQRAESIPTEWRVSDDIARQVSKDARIGVLGVPTSSGILSLKELEITENYDALALLQKMATRELTSYEVTLAFCKRAAIAQQVNCLTEMFFDRALQRAKYLDDQLQKSGVVGPLHGLPVSIKDCFRIEGIDSISGYAAFAADGPSTANSKLIDFLLNSGAVLYVKTNVPQTMMVAEADNNVFGRTLNPHKLCLGPGGSSGGEGALLAMRGSVLGFGTDIGGSVRIPALCCGLFGFKPTVDRIPYGGQTPFVKDGYPPDVSCAAGPLAHSARDIHFILKTIIESKPWTYDFTALAMPWSPTSLKNPLTVGCIFEDSRYPVASPVLRTMHTAIDKLRQMGMSVVTLSDFPSFEEAAKLTWNYFDLDNTLTSFKAWPDVTGEPLVSAIEKMYRARLDAGTYRTLEDLFDMNVKRSAIRRQWHEIFMSHSLDIVVCPANRSTAMPHDEYGITAYTAMWNLVNYPACVIPYGNADKSIDHAESRMPFYDAEISDKAPCSIQAVTRTGQDEDLVAAVDLISQALA